MSTNLETSAAFGAVSGLAVLADPTLKDDLSKPALALATALDQGLGQALGLGKGLTDAGLDAVTNIVGDIAAASADTVEIVGGLMQAIPIFGQLVGVVLKIAALGFAQSKTPVQRCQEWLRLYAAVPTGSVLGGGGGQPFVPADYFARIIDATGGNFARTEEREAAIDTGFPMYAGIITPSDRRYRSLLGMALMLVTEGTLIDERDLSDADWRTGKRPTFHSHPPYALELIDRPKARIEGKHIEWADATYSDDLGKLLSNPEMGGAPDIRKMPEALKTIYRRQVRDYYEAFAKAWRKGTEDYGAGDSAKNDKDRTKRGLPRVWRRRFRGLRRGIESLHHKGDGGTGLWILYMDLLATAYQRGYLSRDFIYWNIIVDNNLPCVESLSDTMTQMATNWSHTIKPYYTQGQAKIDALLGTTAEPPSDSVSRVASNDPPTETTAKARDASSSARFVTTLAKALFPLAGLWSALGRRSDGDGA